HDHDHDHAVESGSASNSTVVEDHAGHDHAHDTPSTNSTSTVADDHAGHDHAGHDHASDATTGDAEAGHTHSHAAGFDEETCMLETDVAYDLNFRIGSIFIIAGTSAMGILLPICLHRIRPNYSQHSVRSWLLMIGKFFGTGVILSTAFIHMLPEAMERFDSPCLSDGWHSYHGFGGVFCMIAAFALQWIELIALSHIHTKQQQASNSAATSTDGDANIKQVALENGNAKAVDCHDQLYSPSIDTSNDSAMNRISTFLLEFGIAMHSIIIGITLGLSSEDTFIILLIALIFHQFFEGIALGTRINDLNYKTWLKPLVMCIGFFLMTPIGLAIGIDVRTVVNVNSLVLSQAILDALSAGILLYNAYISLMSVEVNHSKSFHALPWSRKLTCLGSMYIGAAVMSVIGIWA
ncbi:ZIP zinc transporter-domain-containing protein, partial [Gongronella butleri]